MKTGRWILLLIVSAVFSIFLMAEEQDEMIRCTILFDNYPYDENLATGWGFACLIEGFEKAVLFDTGADGEILLQNMQRLGIDPGNPEIVIISHHHWDHIGGLGPFLQQNANPELYLPPSMDAEKIRLYSEMGASVQVVKEPQVLVPGVCVTGPMGSYIIEQSLILETSQGLVIITGCAHPGIVEIVRKAVALTGENVYLVFGGFHLRSKTRGEIANIIDAFREIGVQKVGPTHCTGDQAIQAFRQDYGKKFVPMGVGRVIEFPR